jgi:hypothetical protein
MARDTPGKNLISTVKIAGPVIERERERERESKWRTHNRVATKGSVTHVPSK